jgi:ribosomal protein S16
LNNVSIWVKPKTKNADIRSINQFGYYDKAQTQSKYFKYQSDIAEEKKRGGNAPTKKIPWICWYVHVDSNKSPRFISRIEKCRQFNPKLVIQTPPPTRTVAAQFVEWWF